MQSEKKWSEEKNKNVEIDSTETEKSLFHFLSLSPSLPLNAKNFQLQAHKGSPVLRWRSISAEQNFCQENVPKSPKKMRRDAAFERLRRFSRGSGKSENENGSAHRVAGYFFFFGGCKKSELVPKKRKAKAEIEPVSIGSMKPVVLVIKWGKKTVLE